MTTKMILTNCHAIFPQTLVRPATAAVSFIASMVQQMFHLPLHLREVHLLNSIRLFMRKASMLAAYVDSKMCVVRPRNSGVLSGTSVCPFSVCLKLSLLDSCILI